MNIVNVNNPSQLDLSAQEFWTKVKDKDQSKIRCGDDASMFPVLSKFAFNMLCLQHSSANVERIFSEVNLIKTKQRNRLSTASIVGHLHVKNYLMSRNETCYDTDFSKELMNRHNSNIYKRCYDEITDSDSDSR